MTFSNTFSNDEIRTVEIEYVDERTFTVREYIEAIRKNGVEHIHGAMFRSATTGHPSNSDIPIVNGACAVGQASMNLGLSPSRFRNLVYTLDSSIVNLVDRTVQLNDENLGTIWMPNFRTLDEIADILTREYEDVLDMAIQYTRAY